MKMRCKNHPAREALSFCHSCKQYYCSACLTEGIDYYYCHEPDCQQAYKQEIEGLNIACLNCGKPISLTKNEGVTKEYKCPHCRKRVMFSRELCLPFIQTRYRRVELFSETADLDQLLLSLNTADNPSVKLLIYGYSQIEAVLASRNKFGLRYHYHTDDKYYNSKRYDITPIEVKYAFREFFNHKPGWIDRFEWQPASVSRMIRFRKKVGKTIRLIWLLLFLLLLMHIVTWFTETVQRFID